MENGGASSSIRWQLSQRTENCKSEKRMSGRRTILQNFQMMEFPAQKLSASRLNEQIDSKSFVISSEKDERL
jgi:hypothetical protein